MLMQRSQQQHLAWTAYFPSRQLDEKFFICINVPIHIPYLYIENSFNIMFFLFFNIWSLYLLCSTMIYTMNTTSPPLTKTPSSMWGYEGKPTCATQVLPYVELGHMSHGYMLRYYVVPDVMIAST